MVSDEFYYGRVLWILVGIMMLGLLLTGGASAATPINSCTTISSPGTYTLNQSISSANICIAITSSDVIFDGAGYTISGDGSYSDIKNYAVYVHNSTTALTNITVKNLIVTGLCDYCIYYNNVQNGSINNNIVSGYQNMMFSTFRTLSGIYLFYSNNNTLIGNNANSNVGHYVTLAAKYDWGNGIVLSSSNNNTLIGNNANSNGVNGIYLTSSNDNTLIGNNANSNPGYSYIMVIGESYYGKGLLLESSNNNLLVSNNANSNGQYDIYLSSSSNNRIYNNYFNITNNYGISNSTNTWNIIKTPGKNIVGGSYLGGNFWAKPDGTGFSQTCADADSDFICDSPYILNSSNIDSLPLVYKTSTSPDTTLPVITITSPINGQRVTTSTITMSGTTSDDSGLIKVEVKAGTGSWQLASGTTTWSATVTLATGSNTIYAKATDTYGNVNETSMVIYNPLPIAEYHFDGNASDSSGNNHNGTINGATFVPGVIGQALSFDGVDDYVRVNNISVGQSITVLAWAKSATPTWNQYGWIASARVANGFIIHPNIGEKYWDGFVNNSDGNLSQIGIYTPGDITQWHQYGVIYDYDVQKGYMVFDGQIVANKSISMTRIAGNINVEFGKDYGFDDRFGNGTIDEISIYNIALNTSEILANYNALADTSTLEPFLVFAITPNSRIAQIGVPITLYLSIINGGTATATNVSITQSSSLPAIIHYQPWDGSLLFTGAKDTPVNIIAGEAVHFVITIVATAVFDSSPMTFNVSGTNAATASIGVVNTLTISGSAAPYADVIMKSTSLNVSTPVNISIAFAVATTNVGAANATNVSLVLSVPSSITGVAYQLNQTNSTTGAIIGPATGLTINVGEQPTFAMFLTPTQPIAYDPGNNRITLKLVDGSGKVIGAQSVAVSTR